MDDKNHKLNFIKKKINTYGILCFFHILVGQVHDEICVDTYIGSIDSCFNAGPTYYSATKSNIDFSDFDDIRFEWNQCTSGGLFKVYFWEDQNGLPGEDIYSYLQTPNDSNAAGWNHIVIPTFNLNSSGDLWVGIREYTATQAIGLDLGSQGCSAVKYENTWEELELGNLAYRLTTCLDDNPSGCFENGCPENYVCVDDWENNCVSSNCDCNEELAQWVCTDDCNGGTCFLEGCMDQTACNYNPDALLPDESCAYELDCQGVCGGNAIEDFCGICEGSATTEEECEQRKCNMELASYLAFGQGTSDITGFFQDDREFAVVGLIQDAAVFVDMTDPFNPFEIARISGTPSTWRDLKYWNRHVYVGTEANDGIKVISVDDPDNPTIVYTITDMTSSHNIYVDSDGYLYVVGAADHDIWIYELKDHPANPTLVGTWDGEYLHDVDVYNDKLYGAGIYSGQFYIVDVSDKTAPITILSHFTGLEGVSTHDCAVTYDEQYLITADETSGGHVKIWDISDYENINMVSEYMTFPNHSIHNIYVRPETNLLIMSYYVDGTRVLDIENPSDPKLVGYFDTSDLSGLYDGNWGTYAYLPSGYIISSDRQNGLFIFDSPLSNSLMEWNICFVVGDMNEDGGLNILDVVTLANCVLAAICDDAGDINQDGGTNVLDIIALVNIILEG